jgi:hypothetical protein
MYELKKKLERYLRVNLLGPGPRFVKIIIYRAAVSQRLRNNAVKHICTETRQLGSLVIYLPLLFTYIKTMKNSMTT